jgi:HSP20 family protein
VTDITLQQPGGAAMADASTKASSPGRSEGGQPLAQRDPETRGLRRWDPAFGSPFDFLDRMSEQMDDWFDRVTRDFGFPRSSRSSRGAFRPSSSQGLWSPRIEAFQKGDQFTVRAELPGLKKEQVQVELTDEALTIHGERQDERQERREGYFHSEREYGTFHRTIPLPDGVIAESAEAAFRDGVLEVTMKAAPSEANRGRKLEIRDGASTESKK